MSASGRRALLLGATGHIGQALLRELLAQGWQVTAATRQPNPAALQGLPVQVTTGNADTPGQLARWVQGHDVVFDAAAPYPMNLFVPAGPAEARPLEHARRRMGELIDAVARQRATLAYVSSYTTLPRPADEGVVAALEARLRRRLHPYFAVKAAMEAQLLEAARGGLPAAVLNPAACMGPWDRRPRDLCVVPLLASRQVPALVSHAMNVIDVRDVARAARLAVEQRRFGEPLALAGHDCRTDEVAALVCRLAGVAAPRRRLPGRLAAAGLGWTEAGWALLKWPSPVPVLGPLLLLDSHPMQPGPAQRAMGVQPRALQQTLADALAWYRQLGYC